MPSACCARLAGAQASGRGQGGGQPRGAPGPGCRLEPQWPLVAPPAPGLGLPVTHVGTGRHRGAAAGWGADQAERLPASLPTPLPPALSILGMHLFGCKFSLKTDTGDTVPDRKNFDSLLWAIVTVFQVKLGRGPPPDVNMAPGEPQACSEQPQSVPWPVRG